MSFVFLAATFAVSPRAVESFPSQMEVAAALNNEVQTGTLIFSRGDCLAVRIYSKSRYTHVAAVVVRNGEPFVYDSISGAGVRCQTLENYLTSQRPDEVHVFQPADPFSPQQSRAFQKHLDGQLGRSYAIKHHLTGERANGVHCAEYVTDALMACHVIRAQQPARVSPASLVEGILKAGLYHATNTIQLKSPPAPQPQGGNWCSRLWIKTKQCSRNSCAKMRRWFLCR